MKKILLGISLLFTLSQADSFNRHGYVVTKSQHTQIVTRTTYNNHWNNRTSRQVDNRRDDRVISALIGGIIGGILGNQIGNGNGRGFATMGGVIIGGIAGSNLSNRGYNRQYETYKPQRRWKKSNWKHNHRRNFYTKRVIVVRGYR